MNLLRLLLSTSSRSLLLAVLAGLASGLTSVAAIALVQVELSRSEPSGLGLAVGFAALVLISSGSRFLAQSGLIRIAFGSVSRLCAELARRILALPLRSFESVEPGHFLSVLTDDVQVVSQALGGIPLLCINVPVVVAGFAYIGWLSPSILAWAVVVALTTVLVYQGLSSRAVFHLQRGRAAQDELARHVRFLLEGFKELKLHDHRRHAFLNEHLGPTAERVRVHTTTGLSLFSLAASFGQAVYLGFFGMLLFVLARGGLVPREAITGVVLVLLYLLSPLEVLLTWVPILGRARVALNRLDELGLSLQNTPNTAIGTEEPCDFRNELRLNGLVYTYRETSEPHPFVLGPIDLCIRPGEIVFITGGNGSGKTTLVKLLSGLYRADEGEVVLDGQVLPTTDDDRLRRLCSVIFADGPLFGAILGVPAAQIDDRASAELARLELDARVQVKQGRFSTTDLSQGQRNRLALIPLLLDDSRPIAILDEWAAHQDPYFKQFFYHNLLQQLRAQGRTVIVVTHDEDYFSVADRVFRLDGFRLSDVTLGSVLNRNPFELTTEEARS